MTADEHGECHLRSFLCTAGHELRVTTRCVTDDLNVAADTHFERLLRHPIVEGLKNERATTMHGGNTVGPEAGDKTLWTLRRGNDHRGATWYDAEEAVVWLCAYGLHRSGTPDDAFQRFAALGNIIYPTAEDYEALEEDRADRFAVRVDLEAQQLLSAARAEPETEKTAVIGRMDKVGLVVHVVETLEQTFVAVVARDPMRLQLLLGSLYPDRNFSDWEWEEEGLPTRPLDRARGEICLSIVHEG
jgi:hypothetical protein